MSNATAYMLGGFLGGTVLAVALTYFIAFLMRKATGVHDYIIAPIAFIVVAFLLLMAGGTHPIALINYMPGVIVATFLLRRKARKAEEAEASERWGE